MPATACARGEPAPYLSVDANAHDSCSEVSHGARRAYLLMPQ
jgi:hypothetical protein